MCAPFGRTTFHDGTRYSSVVYKVSSASVPRANAANSSGRRVFHGNLSTDADEGAARRDARASRFAAGAWCAPGARRANIASVSGLAVWMISGLRVATRMNLISSARRIPTPPPPPHPPRGTGTRPSFLRRVIPALIPGDLRLDCGKNTVASLATSGQIETSADEQTRRMRVPAIVLRRLSAVPRERFESEEIGECRRPAFLLQSRIKR